MEIEKFARVWTLESNEPEAHIAAWKAAAGAAGAHFPQEFRPLAGLNPASLLLAAAEAARVIQARCSAHCVPPRGCEALFYRGEVTLLWTTNNHRIKLVADRSNESYGRILHGLPGGYCSVEASCPIGEEAEAEGGILYDFSAYALEQHEGGQAEAERLRVIAHFPRLVAAEEAAKKVDPEAKFVP